MASSQSRIAELAATVATHTDRVDSYLSKEGLPHPSFEANGPGDLKLPPEIEQSRSMVIEASQELNDLLQGPRNLLFNHEVSAISCCWSSPQHLLLLEKSTAANVLAA